ncbi:hypothetical protein OA40_05750 [Morganella morganii]|nr:hypothetical protein OA40_05750 [Morganella morganii]KNZ90264.1 hypothetical protein AKG16_00125 [Morganella morganii]KOO18763.1 hypothetical protein AC068_10425 [Morganella morganii]
MTPFPCIYLCPIFISKKTRFERTLSDLIAAQTSCRTPAVTALSGKNPSRQHNEMEKQALQTDIAN